MTFAAHLVTLPTEIQLALAAGVLILVRLILAGRVNDKYISEIAAAITTFLVTVINLALGAIPAEFEPLAIAVLNTLVIILGMILAANAYRAVRQVLHERGLRA